MDYCAGRCEHSTGAAPRAVIYQFPVRLCADTLVNELHLSDHIVLCPPVWSENTICLIVGREASADWESHSFDLERH